MDFQFWIYLIIAVIYIVTRALKKPESSPGNPPETSVSEQYRTENRTISEKPRPLSFEDLLREITEAKQPQKPVFQPPGTSVIDYDDDLGEEQQSLETIGKDYRKDDRLYDVYEDAKRLAFERPSLEETMNVNDTVMKFGKFKEFETQNQRNLLEEYTREFRDREGLKKAVVMAEILNRKF